MIGVRLAPDSLRNTARFSTYYNALLHVIPRASFHSTSDTLLIYSYYTKFARCSSILVIIMSKNNSLHFKREYFSLHGNSSLRSPSLFRKYCSPCDSRCTHHPPSISASKPFFNISHFAGIWSIKLWTLAAEKKCIEQNILSEPHSRVSSGAKTIQYWGRSRVPMKGHQEVQA